MRDLLILNPKGADGKWRCYGTQCDQRKGRKSKTNKEKLILTRNSKFKMKQSAPKFFFFEKNVEAAIK
jgi:hypothetical protein